MKSALILDLDNTIYPVSAIAGHLFKHLFELIDESSDDMDYENLQQAKYELTRRPFHFVADEYNFSPELKNKGIALLKTITYDLPMQPFEGYHYLKSLPLKKYLVTTGFSNLQWSKIKMLSIASDFEEIHIVDPEMSKLTKKDVFNGIMQRHKFSPDDLLVVGDDPESEIKAATELGIETFLFDPDDSHPYALVTYKNKQLKGVLEHV